MRVVEVICVLFISLTFAWIAASSLGRTATLREIAAHFRTRESSLAFCTRSLFGIQFLRATATLAALIGSFAAVLLAGRAVSEKILPPVARS